MLSRGFEFGLKIVQGAWLNHAISGYFTCFFAYQQRLADIDWRAGCFIGVVVIRVLGLITEINTASQVMRRDTNKLLYKASSLTEAERRALIHYDVGGEF